MRLPKITSPVVLTVFIGTAAWFVLVVAAAFMVPHGMFTDLSGTTGTHDNEDLFDQVHPLPHAIYWIGDGECHQLANRSYFLNGNQMPFCARDVGLFAGVAIGFGVVTFMLIKINPLFALAGIAPLGVDGTVQMFTDYESTNILRLATGLVAGAACALLLAHFIFALQEERDPGTPENGQPPTPESGQP